MAASLNEALEELGYDAAALLSRAAERLYEEDLLAGRATAETRQITLGPQDQHRVVAAARLVDDFLPIMDASLEDGLAVTMADDRSAVDAAHWIGSIRPLGDSGFSDVIVAWRQEADQRLLRCVRVRDDAVANAANRSALVLAALAAYRMRCSRLGVVRGAWADEVELRVIRLEDGSPPRSLPSASGARPGTIFARPPRLSYPIVGRERELDALSRVLAKLPAIIAVSGEAGVGKTRFVTELVSRSDTNSAPVFIGHCHPLREPFSLGPVVETLREAYKPPRRWPRSTLAGALRTIVPDIADSLPPLPELSRDPGTQRHVLFRAITEVMGYASPATWVFEDLHWADDMTLDFLRILIQRPPPSTTMVLTYRREDLPRSSELTRLLLRVPAGVSLGAVELPVLSVEEVRRLVAAVLGRDGVVSEEFATHLHQRTGGLPFVVEEVAHVIKDRQHGGVAEELSERDVDELDVPMGIRDAVLQRTAGLTASARRIVDASAILDVPAAPAMLASVAGVDVTASFEALTQAVEHAVLVDHGASGYGLRHALASQVIREAIPQSEARRLHRRAAEVLATAMRPPATRLAHHWHEAGALDEWLHNAELAADQSRSVGDDQAAVLLLMDPAAFADQDPRDRARLALKLGIAALHGRMRRIEVSNLLTTVADEVTLTRGTRAELQYLAAVLQAGGVVWDREQLARCVDDLRHRPDLAVSAMVMLAWPWGPRGTLSQHLRWAQRAVSTATAAGDPTLQLTTAAVYAQILTASGDARAPSAMDRVPWGNAAVVDLRRFVMASVGLAWSLITIGEAEPAQLLFERAQQARKRVAYDPYLDHNLETLSVMRNFHLGDWQGLATRAARHASATRESPDWWVSSQLVIAELALARQDLDNAARWFEEGREAAAAAGLTPAELDACAGTARMWLARGQPQMALEIVRTGVDLLANKGIWVWGTSMLPTAVEAMLTCGQPETALALTARFARGLRGRRAPLAQAALWECR
ncbi:MAG: ATP-binding protein, partial [Candidatus Dormibacteria bacterium]